jgi:hypothetical protein
MGTSGSYQGAEVVTARAREYAEGKLEIIFRACFLVLFSPLARFKKSKFDNKQDLAAFTESFDTGLKVTFSDSSKPQFVKFGSLRDNDTSCGVKAGKLTVQG